MRKAAVVGTDSLRCRDVHLKPNTRRFRTVLERRGNRHSKGPLLNQTSAGSSQEQEKGEGDQHRKFALIEPHFEHHFGQFVNLSSLRGSHQLIAPSSLINKQPKLLVRVLASSLLSRKSRVGLMSSPSTPSTPSPSDSRAAKQAVLNQKWLEKATYDNTVVFLLEVRGEQGWGCRGEEPRRSPCSKP